MVFMVYLSSYTIHIIYIFHSFEAYRTVLEFYSISLKRLELRLIGHVDWNVFYKFDFEPFGRN